MAQAEAAAAAADVDEVVVSDPASVAQALSSVVNLAQQCLASIEEAYEFYTPFQKNTVMCLAIRRNLLNLVDTLKIVRFLSRTVDGLLTDLADSLALCADFLREYCPSNGADEERFIGDEEEEEVVNKLAFMNKLLHLNQHSINIRLLIEAPEHARIAEKDPKPEQPSSLPGVKAPSTPQKGAPTEDAKTPATVQRLKPSDSSAPRLSVSPSGQIKSGGENDRDRVILSHTLEQALAEVQSKIQIQSPNPTPHLSAVNQYRPHRSQYVYGPIHAPSYFLSASRAKEFAELVHHVKKIPANAPCVIIITGPQGVGKTSYAKYIAQKLHAFMDYHVFLPCYVPETGGKEQSPAPSPHRQSVAAEQTKEKDRSRRRQLDSDSLMRACLSPSQLECLNPNEIDKAFKDLVWAKKGILLLDDVQSEDQIASLIPVTPPNAPRPAQCLMIITSCKPMNRLTEKLRLAGSSSRDPSLSSTYYYTQALEPLPTEVATRVLQGGRTHAANEDDPSLLSDRQAVVLSSLGDGYPLVLDLLYHQLTLSSDPNAVVKQLTAAPSAEEKKMFQNTMVHVAQDLQHIFFYAYSHVPPASQSFFARLFIFPGTFDIAAVMSIFKLDLAAVKERLRPLLQCGLVMEHEVSSVSRRKAQQAKKMIEAQKTLDRNEAKSAKDTFAGMQQGQPIEPVSRYFVHELLRDFSFLVACKTENVSQLFVAFSTYYAEALKKVDNFLSSDSKANQAEAFRLYDADSHNFRAAIQEALNRSLEVPTASVLLCPRSLYAARLSAKRRVEMYTTYIELDGVKSLRTLGHCASLCAIADSHTALSEFEKAIPYYKQAQKLAEHLNSPAHVAAAFRGLAHISEGLGEHQIAIDYCLKCQTMLTRLEQNNNSLSKNVKASLCDLLLYMSTLHVALGAFQNGVDLLKECRRINDQHVKDPSTTARVLYALGELHTRLGEWETAVELLRDSALEAQKNYDWRTLARAYRMLDRAHESMGRFYKANCYREKLTQLIQLSDLPLH